MAGYLEDLRIAQCQLRESVVLPEDVAAAPKSLVPADSAKSKDTGVGPVLLGQRHCTEVVSKTEQQPEPATLFRGPVAATPFEEREPFTCRLWIALAMQAAFTFLVAYVTERIAPMATVAIGRPFTVTFAFTTMFSAQAALSYFRHAHWGTYLLVAKVIAEGVSWGLAAEVAALPLLGPLSLGIWSVSSSALAIGTYTGILTIFGWIAEPSPEWCYASKTWLMNSSDHDKRRRCGLRKFVDMAHDEEGGMTRATFWFALFAWTSFAMSAFAIIADTYPDADFRSAQVASVASFVLLVVSVHGVEKQVRRCLIGEWASAILNLNNDFLHAFLALCTLTFLFNPMEEAGGLAKPASLIDSIFLAPSFLAAMEEGRQAAAQMRAEASTMAIASRAAAPAAAASAQIGQSSDRDHADSETEGLLRSVFRRRWSQQGQ